MTILKCDKCGKELTREEAMVIEINEYIYRRTTEPYRCDLCKDCVKVITDWLNWMKLELE